MVRRSSCDGTAAAANHVGPIDSLDGGGPAQFRQNSHGEIDPLLAAPTRRAGSVLVRNFAADFAHGLSEFASSESPTDCGEHHIQKSAIRFRE